MSRVAIITGAASGIGAATARLLSARGDALVLNDLDEANLEQVRQGLEHPDEAICLAADVGDDTTGARLTQAARNEFGRIDFLVNNAGIADLVPAEALTLERWNRVVQVNLTGAFLVAQAAGQAMIEAEQGGSIVNVSSMAGVAAMPHHASYVASKHGVVGLTRALAVEWARYGIRVNALCPGLTDTEIVRRAAEQDPGVIAARAERNLFGRLSTAEEQAHMIQFLVSDEASYVSGLIANVDAGGLALYSGYSGSL